MAVADRDGQSFEFAYGDTDGMASELRDNARKTGVGFFTRVRFKGPRRFRDKVVFEGR
jgi:hypothetical protein